MSSEEEDWDWKEILRELLFRRGLVLAELRQIASTRTGIACSCSEV